MPRLLSAKPTRIQRILLVRTDRLGDVVLTLPMLPFLRSRFPDAHIAMLVNTYTGEIVKGNPYVNELLWYDDQGQSVPFLMMLRKLRAMRFDAAVVAHPTLRLGWLMYLAGIPLRVGSGYRYYSILFNRRVYEHRSDARKHEVEYNLGLLNALDCAAEGKAEFYIDMSTEDRIAVRELLDSLHVAARREIVILHPGSGNSARNWPAEGFAALAERLRAERDATIIITGARGDEEKARKILNSTHNSAVSLVGKLSLKELAALIHRSALFVSNSTGPIHLAAAVGTPVVGLYSQITAMSAVRWGPYTERKRVLVPRKPIDCKECDASRGDPCACMASISVSEVYEAATDLLSHSRGIPKGVTVNGG